MKVTNRQVVECGAALVELQGIELPFKLSYKVAKTVKMLAPLADALNDTRRKIGEKFAKRDENDEVVTKTVDGQEGIIDFADPAAADIEMRSLFEVDNDVHLQKFRASDFGDIMLKPWVILALEWLIEDDESSTPASPVPAP